MFKLFRRLCLPALVMVLSACGGGGGGDDSPALDGGVVKGPVLGATVCVYQLANGVKGTQLALTLPFGAAGSLVNGCYVTPASGSYNFRLPRGSSGDVLIESTGGTFCSNEVQVANGACAGGTLVNLGAAVMTSAATLPASGGSSTIYTTPLTTAAVNAAAGASFTAARFNAQFATLAGQLIGNMAVTPSTPPTTATQAYLTQVSTYLQNGGSLTNAVNSLAQGTTTFTATGGGATSPATVSAALAGTYNLQFDGNCAGICSYTHGQSVSVTVHADGRLVIGSTTLANPYYRDFGAGPHLPEVIWLDSANNVEYAMSDNTGSFNEINVGNAADKSAGYPAFLGQLKAPTTGNLAMVAALQGTYPIAYQYKGPTVPWTSVVIAADGAIRFTGGTGPAAIAAEVATVTNYVSCCGYIAVNLSIDINASGTVDNNDRILLYKDNAGALRSIEFNTGNPNVSTDMVGVRLGTVSAITHDGSPVPGASRIQATLAGTPFDQPLSNTSVNSFSINAHADTAGNAPGIHLQLAPNMNLAAGTTYACRITQSATIEMNIRIGTATYQTRNGGRCAITVTNFVAGTIAEGLFTAEVVDNKQTSTPIVINDGRFRWTP